MSQSSIASSRGRSGSASLTALAVAAAFFAQAAAQTATAAPPVIPGAAGYGITTVAGRGGRVYRVTNLNETGSGSLYECTSASGPRVCIFEVSGTIKMTGNLGIKNPYLTIAGQTAPSPGIMLRGASIIVGASDVLIQHLRVRVGDDPTGTEPDNRDALRIEAPAASPIKNVIVDHCSFSWSIDEMASIWEGAGEISLLNNIFGEALDDSLHSKGPHGFGLLFGFPYNKVGRIAMVNNVLAHMVERNPLSRAPRLIMVNNVVYNRRNYDTTINVQDPEAINSIVGNVFIRGVDYTKTYPPVIITTPLTTIPFLSKVRFYVADNVSSSTGATLSSMSSLSFSSLEVRSPLVTSLISASSPADWPAGLTARKTANNEALNYTLAQSGARPADRDAVDTRIVNSIKNHTGSIINCVTANGSERCKKNGGGWPVLANNKRTLTLPADPNAVDDTGYTNLEKWLHTMAAQVEGRSAQVPRPPSGLQVE